MKSPRVTVNRQYSKMNSDVEYALIKRHLCNSWEEARWFPALDGCDDVALFIFTWELSAVVYLLWSFSTVWVLSLAMFIDSAWFEQISNYYTKTKSISHQIYHIKGKVSIAALYCTGLYETIIVFLNKDLYVGCTHCKEISRSQI